MVTISTSTILLCNTVQCTQYFSVVPCLFVYSKNNLIIPYCTEHVCKKRPFPSLYIITRHEHLKAFYNFRAQIEFLSKEKFCFLLKGATILNIYIFVFSYARTLKNVDTCW